MALNEKIQPIEIPFTLVESGVGTYTELEIVLPVILQDGIVFDIDQIEYNFSHAFDPVAAGDTQYQIQFSLQSLAAITGWNDNDIIAAVRLQAQASAALLHSGVDKYELHMDTRGRANYVARTSIFLGIDSINTTAVVRTQGRIIGSLVKVGEKALTQLVLQQLT